MKTNIGVNSPQAVKRWAHLTFVQYRNTAYFSKFEGRNPESIIHEVVDLEEAPGDEVSFDLLMEIRGDMVEGDETLAGREYPIRYAQDRVRIDQQRMATDLGGRMTRKRTLHDIREAAKGVATRFAASWFDEMKFVYLSGTAPGTYVNQDSNFRRPTAGNPIQAPDRNHIAYGGSASSKATLEAAHTMSRDLIAKVGAKAAMMTAEDATGTATAMRPVSVDGGSHYIMLMSPYQLHSLRIEKSELSWADIQKNAGVQGSGNALFKGSAGMLNDIVLHSHKGVRRMNDYGAAQNVEAHRALLLGAQAGILAYGVNGKGSEGTRFSWNEESRDYGNSVGIAVGTICGFKKTRFNDQDFGVMAVDTAAKAPLPVAA